MDKHTEGVAYAAGLLEGEGSIRSNGVSAIIQIQMCDKEPLDKLKDIFSCGVVRGPYTRGRTKPTYTWTIAERKCVQPILNAIYPFMSPRRQEQIDSVRHIFESPKKSRWN